jgi:hypothetical protein
MQSHGFAPAATAATAHTAYSAIAPPPTSHKEIAVVIAPDHTCPPAGRLPAED